MESSQVLSKRGLGIPSHYFIDFNDIVLNDKIHESELSVIYEGEYNGHEVAVKIFNQAFVDVQTFKEEFQLLSTIRSPHMVYFYGLCVEPKICVVMELCKGTMEEYLANRAKVFNWEIFFKLGETLLASLKMLHHQNLSVIHSAIRPPNILMTGYWQLKMGDFGRMRYNSKGKRITTTYDEMAMAYSPPEILVQGATSDKGDVYSAAIVIWEMAARTLTGRHIEPYEGVLTRSASAYEKMSAIVKQNLRPKKLDDMHPDLWRLLQKAWHTDPDQRPTSREFFNKFRELEEDYEENPDAWETEPPPPPYAMHGGSGAVALDFDDNDSYAADHDRVDSLSAIGSGSSGIAMTQEEMEAIRLQVDSKVAQELHKPAMRSVLQQIQLRRRTLRSSASHGADLQAKDVQLHKLLGRGAFGEVWKGVVHGTEVAVKKLLIKDIKNERGIIQDFMREVQMMTKLRHGNICQLMGVCMEKDNLMLVMEYCQNGDVHTLLNGQTPLTFFQRMQIARDVALSMNWLHCMNPPILHLDLKPANFLLDKNMTVKVADFGLAKIQGGKVEAGWGTQFYMSPEAQRGDAVITEKADVFSFGVCLWQLLSRENPFKYERRGGQDVWEPRELRVPDWCPSDTLKKLIEECWHPDPAMRPSFSKILAHHSFPRILLEAEIYDTKARDFWGKYFLVETAPKPTWPVFWSCLATCYRLQVHASDEAIIMFRSALVTKEDVVTAANLQKFVDYFGPFDCPAMISRLYDLGSQKWFHGDLSQKEAEGLLASSSNYNGSWLVRYATRPGDFRISVIPYNLRRRITFKHFVIVNNEPYRGEFVWLQAPKGADMKSLETEREQLLKSDKLKRYKSIRDLIKDNQKSLGIKYDRYIDAHTTTFSKNGSNNNWAPPRVSSMQDV
jgi:serine/threonine protein kinase